MSGLARRLARRREDIIVRRRPYEGFDKGVLLQYQMKRGDAWWRARYAESVEKDPKP